MRRCASIANVARNELVSRKYALLIVVATIVVAIDQLTKELALTSLADGPIHIIDGAFSLNLSYNSGGAFGILQGLPGFFLVATIVIAGLILVWVRHVESARNLVSLGLVLGGGIGNLIDRIVREPGGRVVDFIDLHVWPVFNLADSSIVIGVILLLIFTARTPDLE